MTKNKILSIVNALSVFVVILINFNPYIVVTNNNTVPELSDKYSNLFTPADYVFAIWGLIFLSLIAYAVFHLIKAFKGEQLKEHMQTGWWFALVNFANAGWVIVWLNEYIALSVVLIIIMLIGLLAIISNTKMIKYHAPRSIRIFVWWPIGMYSGWISVATVASFATFLKYLGWDGSPFNEITWTVLMIVVASGINLLVLWKLNLRGFVMVAVWALLGIYVRHQVEYNLIAWTALVMAIVIFANILFHRFSNRKRVALSS